MSGDIENGAERAFSVAEALLQHIHPKDDVSGLGRALREAYVSPSALFESSAFMLERTGLHPHDALLISTIRDLNRIREYDRYGNRPQLGRLPMAARYLINTFRGIYVERFYMLCLDARGRLIRRALINEGSEDAAVFNLRKLIETVIQTRPTGVIITHNHPGCTARPSQEDIDCTYDAIHALEAVGVPLLDHIIMAGDQPVSMRDLGFVPAAVWIGQQEDNKLLLNWLSTENMPKSSYKAD